MNSKFFINFQIFVFLAVYQFLAADAAKEAGRGIRLKRQNDWDMWNNNNNNGNNGNWNGQNGQNGYGNNFNNGGGFNPYNGGNPGNPNPDTNGETEIKGSVGAAPDPTTPPNQNNNGFGDGSDFNNFNFHQNRNGNFANGNQWGRPILPRGERFSY